MGNRKRAITILERDGSVLLTCNGNSMRPLMKPKDLLYIKKISPHKFRIDDAVFCKVNSGLQVHKITAINKDRYQISNNFGKVNGFIGINNIFGLCIKVNDRELISEKELERRD